MFLDPVLLPSSRQRFPFPHRAAGSDALLKGDGGDSILQSACWPHSRRTELPGAWGEALQGLLCRIQSALHPSESRSELSPAAGAQRAMRTSAALRSGARASGSDNGPAHKHARQKDRKTAGLACALEAKAHFTAAEMYFPVPLSRFFCYNYGHYARRSISRLPPGLPADAVNRRKVLP